MLKTLTLAGGLVLAGLSFAPQSASAASLGDQGLVGASAASDIQTVQYGYGYRRRGYGYRRFYGPRRFYGGPRRFYGRPYGYGPRPFYRY